jgi:hypothetical protein
MLELIDAPEKEPGRELNDRLKRDDRTLAMSSAMFWTGIAPSGETSRWPASSKMAAVTTSPRRLRRLMRS